ncbi:MAG: virulence-associated E family protein [Oscillospiraceae bacterium]|jgi:predicted P-loop ATPase|nr:virulence-associated E family protein [Oscillospiraceae bacterium]
MKYDGQLTISTGDSRKCTHWKTQTILWSALVERLREPTRTQETAAEFKAMTKPRRDEIKDVGGFVGGQLRGGRRKVDAVLNRCLLTLDIDSVPAGEDPWENFFLGFDCAAALYSTHSHTTEAPRMRLVLPLNRPSTPDEYAALSRKVAKEIGIDMCDDTTYEPHRLMYFASVPRDGEYHYEVQDGPWLDVDAVLAGYHDWRDASQWPTSSRKAEVIRKLAKKQGDPSEKPGVVGAFGRAYTIPAALNAFLPGVYTPAGEGRYTFAAGSTAGGLVLYDNDAFAYSHHATDPCGERLVNAFDLVRLHLYGDQDDDAAPDTPMNKLPSYGAMCELAAKDKLVKSELAKQGKRLADEFDEPEDWKSQLDYDKKGHLRDTLENLVLILRHDEGLISIAFNQHRDGIAVRDNVPWEQLKPGWNDSDMAALLTYISAEYRLHSPGKTKTALLAVAAERKYHPVRDYFNELPSWRGEERAEQLLIRYLGASDTPYVRCATRKWLIAAVKRTYEPGTKFDNALVFVGGRGLGKSMLGAKLAGKWFGDSLSLADMHDGKRAAEKLQGCLIQELAEMSGMRKADLETIKAFMSRSDDMYRAAYGVNVESHPRQCVIYGTTNETEGFLRDPTGNRNFWIVYLKSIKPRGPWELTQDDIDQIWAEAKYYYEQGENLLLSPELEAEAFAQQESAMETDERAGLVEQYLERLLPENWGSLQPYERQQWLDGAAFGGCELGTVTRTEVCNAEIWCECLGKRSSDLKRQDSYEIRAIMKQIPGWERQLDKKRFGCYGPQLYYKRVL